MRGHPRLTWRIPSDITKLSSLTFFNVEGDNFTGPILPDLVALPLLSTLNLGNNSFYGTVPVEALG